MHPPSSVTGPRTGDVTVHLVRHGQSTWNLEGRLQGQTAHPPLTALGREQATAAAQTLLDRIPPIDHAGVHLWSSDLTRARQTAAIIASRLGVEVHSDAALREQGLGSLEGRLSTELVAEATPPGRHVSEIRWGGGESIADVHRRVGAFFTRISPESPRHLVVVTHGDTLRVARAWLQGHGHREVAWDVVANGSVLTMSVK